MMQRRAVATAVGKARAARGVSQLAFAAPPPTPNRRVVVTGLGAVTPLGVGVSRTWEALLNSECAVQVRFTTSPLPRDRFSGSLSIGSATASACARGHWFGVYDRGSGAARRGRVRFPSQGPHQPQERAVPGRGLHLVCARSGYAARVTPIRAYLALIYLSIVRDG